METSGMLLSQTKLKELSDFLAQENVAVAALDVETNLMFVFFGIAERGGLFIVDGEDAQLPDYFG